MAAKTPGGVHCLAVLLTELQPGVDGPQILAADALYQLGRVEEAHRLLLALGAASQRAPVLARLALLQLNRGFMYDANQLLKKLIQCGDTSCLRPLLALARPKDKALLQGHCHAASKRLLVAATATSTSTTAVAKEEGVLREAIAYLSIAIMASGGGAVDSLLERAHCYALLGQRKTAIYDFSVILKEQPSHVHALCGRGFTYLTLSQQKECTEDILSALQLSVDTVTKDILSLKDKARTLVCDWLEQYCRTDQLEPLVAKAVPCQEGEVKAAGAHLSQVFGQEPREAVAQARVGVVEAWLQGYQGAARRLSRLAERDPASLGFLLSLVPLGRRSAHLQLQETPVPPPAGPPAWPSWASTSGPWPTSTPVIRNHKEDEEDDEERGGRAEDLCRRGRSLLLSSREGPALDDFSRALELHRGRAVRCAEAGVGRGPLAECFLRGALRRYGEQQLARPGSCWRPGCFWTQTTPTCAGCGRG
ncbi:hypothetical protein CRUP_016222 [Coryphaenoides rupestris]|nr:hypothetical protein CRUP_016222 [Coryphaenoides rupestris]